MIYFQLFVLFFKVGLFGFGGGYAMIPLIYKEVVETNGWITDAEFTDIIAISQVAPGSIAINSATYIGYEATQSVWGAAVATIAVVLPSLLVMLIICRFFFVFRNSKYMAFVFAGLKPAVAGLIASAAILLINASTFIDYKSIILFLLAFITAFRFKVNPILLIVLASIAGFLLY